MIADWLLDWQSLFGAVLGVIGAFLVAWWGFSTGRRLDRRSAAIELSIELSDYAEATRVLLKQGADNSEAQTAGMDDMQAGADRMILYRPRLSPRFLEMEARLHLADPVLVTHLRVMRRTIESAEAYFTRLEEAERLARTTGDPTISDEELRQLLRSAGNLASVAVHHAGAATQEIDKLFLRPSSGTRRLLLRIPFVQRARVKTFREGEAARLAEVPAPPRSGSLAQNLDRGVSE